MLISPVNITSNYNSLKFKQRNVQTIKSSQANENPISRKGEFLNTLKATFIGGLVLAGKLFLELIDEGDFVWEKTANKASELVEKNKKDLNKNKKMLCKIGAFISLFAAGATGIALLYTIYKTPKIIYDSKVNSFKKSKEMDTYIQSNKAEKELYQQLADKATNADELEKDNLKEQYSKMVLAKNKVPDFVKIK